MPATAPFTRTGPDAKNRARTARIRARCASAAPRITRATLAERVNLAVGTVKNVLSDNAPWDVTDTLDKLEAALDAIEAEAREVSR